MKLCNDSCVSCFPSRENFEKNNNIKLHHKEEFSLKLNEGDEYGIIDKGDVKKYIENANFLIQNAEADLVNSAVQDNKNDKYLEASNKKITELYRKRKSFITIKLC